MIVGVQYLQYEVGTVTFPRLLYMSTQALVHCECAPFTHWENCSAMPLLSSANPTPSLCCQDDSETTESKLRRDENNSGLVQR